jgi:hypothetical protein
MKHVIQARCALLSSLTISILLLNGCSGDDALILEPQDETELSSEDIAQLEQGEPPVDAELANDADGDAEPEEDAPMPEIGADGEGRDVSGLATLPSTYWEYRLGYHGGSGGSYTSHVGTGVIYAVQVNSGAYVDRIRFAYYLPSAQDNYYRAGDYVGTTQALGGSGGGVNPWFTCPGGRGIIGLRGASGAFVDRLGVICGDVNHPDPNSAFNVYSDLWGGGGGGWFQDTCRPGDLITGFDLRSGGYVDAIQAICIPAH